MPSHGAVIAPPAARRPPIRAAPVRPRGRSDAGARRAAPRTIVARQQVAGQALHERPDEARLLACERGRDRGHQPGRVAPDVQRAATHEHEVGDALDHLPVGQDVGAGDVEREPARGVRGRRRGEQEGTHVAHVDRLRAVLAPGRQGEHLHPFDDVHEKSERARARADHDRCAQRDALGQACEQDPLDLEPAAEMARQRPALRHETAEVDDAAHARPLRGRDELLRRDALVVLEDAARAAALHRVDEEVRDIDAVQRLVESRAGDRVAADERQRRGHARGIAAEAAQVVAATCESREQCGSDRAARAGQQDAHGPAWSPIVVVGKRAGRVRARQAWAPVHARAVERRPCEQHRRGGLAGCWAITTTFAVARPGDGVIERYASGRTSPPVPLHHRRGDRAVRRRRAADRGTARAPMS